MWWGVMGGKRRKGRGGVGERERERVSYAVWGPLWGSISDPAIMTWAEIKNQTLNWLSHSGTLDYFNFNDIMVNLITCGVINWVSYSKRVSETKSPTYRHRLKGEPKLILRVEMIEWRSVNKWQSSQHRVGMYEVPCVRIQLKKVSCMTAEFS